MKGSFKTALIAAVVSAVVSAGAAVATTQTFVLGTNNRVNAPSDVTNVRDDGTTVNPIDAPLLTLENKSATANAAPLSLIASPSHPALKVNTQAKVANLNADQLDGKDSSAFLPSSGNITLWYSPYDYAGEYLPISVTLARTDGPSVVATSSSTSNQPVVLPLDQPQSIFGRALKLKSVTVCFASAGAPITSTQIVYGVIAEANIAYADTYTHSSTQKTCYDVSPTTPTALPGSAYLRLTVYFSSNSIYLYSVKEVLGT